jgi:predicted dithiol-disulfide oxidoreductase (DUF899 family)
VTVLARETVENSLVLDAFELARNGRLRDGGAGTIVWFRDDREIARVTWRVEDDEYLHLLYTDARGDGQTTEDFYWLWLERTPAPIGGERVWFACPWCEKRVFLAVS